MNTFKICHLFPDTLNLYGDRGNILCMVKRLEWRGISVEIHEVPVGAPLNTDDYDIFFIGGGEDFERTVIMDDLQGCKGDAIKAAIENGKVFLAICGGFQLLGNFYETIDGKRIAGLGAIDVYTVEQKQRLVGDYKFKLNDSDVGNEIIGFENHTGLTYLGEQVSPLGTVLVGSGNNGQDKTEGARYKNLFASYSHGPLLSKNPKFCDYLLSLAIKEKGEKISLSPLDDSFELDAYNFMNGRLQK